MYRRVGIVAALFVFMAGALGAVVNAQSATPAPTPAEVADQEFDYEKAYADYVFALDQYESAHSDYLLTRAQYLQAGTLIAETRARDSAVAMLEARDEVVITYLLAVRMKLTDSPGVTLLTRGGYITRLDAEIAWYRDHKNRISSVGSLNDVVDDSNEADGQYTRITLNLIYEVLSTIATGKVGVAREGITGLLGDIKIKTAEIRARGDHDVQTVERWIISAENKQTRALDKEIEAQTLLQTIQGSNGQKVYSDVLVKTEESLQFLKETSSNMREIILAIRTKS
jgi:hypothetical protein